MLANPFQVEDDFKYSETIASSFDSTSIFCMSPVIYQRYMHKNLTGTGILDYHCPVENLPYDQFPGWDDPLAYSPLCRPFYKYQKANPM